MNCLPTSSCTEAATAAFGACCRRVSGAFGRLAAVRSAYLPRVTALLLPKVETLFF